MSTTGIYPPLQPVEERIVTAWDGSLSVMTASGHELVTLAIRETVTACHEVRRYTVDELGRALDTRHATLSSRFNRAGVPAPFEIIRAVRVLVGVHLVEANRRKRYAKVTAAALTYGMGHACPTTFARFVRMASPPGFAGAGLDPLDWFRTASFAFVADGYARLLLPPDRWRGFVPIGPHTAPMPVVRRCAECHRPYRA